MTIFEHPISQYYHNMSHGRILQWLYKMHINISTISGINVFLTHVKVILEDTSSSMSKLWWTELGRLLGLILHSLKPDTWLDRFQIVPSTWMINNCKQWSIFLKGYHMHSSSQLLVPTHSGISKRSSGIPAGQSARRLYRILWLFHSVTNSSSSCWSTLANENARHCLKDSEVKGVIRQCIYVRIYTMLPWKQ